MKLNLKNVPRHLHGRTWYTEGDAYAFLVDAPITLGHSQLWVRSCGTEEDSFTSAAVHIAKCIKILRLTIWHLDLKEWTALARYTGTSGTYQKTLLLKTSATEKKEEYKVHLVPYFCSHLDATNQLYCALQGAQQPASGGLLHWVGERERVVDYDMRDGRDDAVVKKRIASFKLRRLTSKLSAAARKCGAMGSNPNYTLYGNGLK